MGQRYKREIEELLERLEEGTTSQEPGRPRGKKQKAKSSKRPKAPQGKERGVSRNWGISPGKVFLASLVLLLVALLLRATAPGVVGPIAWIGVGLFVVAYILFFLRPQGPNEKRWRGRLLEGQGKPWWRVLGDRFKRK